MVFKIYLRHLNFWFLSLPWDIFFYYPFYFALNFLYTQTHRMYIHFKTFYVTVFFFFANAELRDIGLYNIKNMIGSCIMISNLCTYCGILLGKTQYYWISNMTALWVVTLRLFFQRSNFILIKLCLLNTLPFLNINKWFTCFTCKKALCWLQI